MQQLRQREIMQAHIDACKASGKKVEQYCKEHNIKSHNYYYWHRILFKVKSSADNFIQLKPMQAVGHLNITLPNGVMIQFESLPSVEYLKLLVCCI
jgi:hypothetical protein